ncbi:MAG: InlB B-repeat-containing protein, partial [Clostridia bacterium]
DTVEIRQVSKQVTHTVSYYLTYYDIFSAEVVKDGEFAPQLDAPEREGCLFVAWLLDGAEYDFASTVTGSITLFAHYEEVPPSPITKHTVSFCLGEGEVWEQVTVDSGTAVSMPTAPERQGFLFVGWYENGEQYDFATVVESDLFLYAEFEKVAPKEYTVCFYADAGELFFSIRLTSEQTIIAPDSTPSKNGYNFSHWEHNGEPFVFGKAVESDINLYAVFVKIPEYSVSYFDGESQLFFSKQYTQVEKGKKIFPPEPPSKTGMTFGGWCTDEECTTIFDFDTPIVSNLTLYAAYNAILYEINIQICSNVCLALEKRYARHGESISYSFEVALGYKLEKNTLLCPAGNALDNANNSFIMPAHDVTLVIKAGSKYMLYIQTQEGIKEVAYGETLELDIPQREGYTFIGWYTNGSLEQEFDGVARGREGEIITLYPKYAIITYTAKFVYGENMATIYTESVPYNQTPTPPKNLDFGHSAFAGWSESIAPLTSDKTYYATYTTQYNNYYLNGESTILTTMGEMSSTPTQEYNIPEKRGHIFKGFALDRVDGYNIYYTALFEAKKYTIEIIADNGGILTAYGAPEYGNKIILAAQAKENQEILSVAAEGGLTITKVQGGIYTFTMPDSDVKIYLTTQPLPVLGDMELDVPGTTTIKEKSTPYIIASGVLAAVSVLLFVVIIKLRAKKTKP